LPKDLAILPGSSFLERVVRGEAGFKFREVRKKTDRLQLFFASRWGSLELCPTQVNAGQLSENLRPERRETQNQIKKRPGSNIDQDGSLVDLKAKI
jgi:hypothetical protein